MCMFLDLKHFHSVFFLGANFHPKNIIHGHFTTIVTHMLLLGFGLT